MLAMTLLRKSQFFGKNKTKQEVMTKSMVKSGHLKKASTLSFVKMKIFMNDFGLKAIRHRWYYKKTKKYPPHIAIEY